MDKEMKLKFFREFLEDAWLEGIRLCDYCRYINCKKPYYYMEEDCLFIKEIEEKLGD